MDLIDKIKSKSAKIAVIGLGYVGLPLAVEKAKAGFHVVGIERKKDRVDKINRGENYIPDVLDIDLKEAVQEKRLWATQSFEAIKDVDVVTICVPTPLDKNKNPVTTYIENVVDNSLPFLKKDQLLVLESTTYPGTTEEIILPQIESRGFKVGEDFYLAYSPERVDPGNKKYKTGNTPKVVGGITSKCTDVAKTLYEQFVKSRIHTVSSPKVAEMEKLFENIFRVVNISLVDELAMLCERMGIDVWEVIEAAKTKPFGFMPFYPGPGLGGHCIPLDPFYLSWKAKEYGFTTRFIELAGEISDSMPEHVVESARKLLNKHGKPLKHSHVLMLGVAYKRDVNDIRESPALKVAKLLLEEEAELSYHDSYVSAINLNGRRYQSVILTPEGIRENDLVLIATDHSNVDYSMIVENAKLIYDTRNALREYNSDNIYKLGTSLKQDFDRLDERAGQVNFKEGNIND